MANLSTLSAVGTDTARNVNFAKTFFQKNPSAVDGAAEYPVTIKENIALSALTNNSPDIQDSFWTYPKVQLARWSKLYPYQFLVLVAQTDSQGETTYSQFPGFQYTFPFPPESLSVTVPIASTVEATLGGIVEQNNAAPFREIQMSGSLGVFAGKESSQSYHSPGSLAKIFGGTVNLLAQTINDGLNVGRAFFNESPLSPFGYTDDDFDDSLASIPLQNQQTVVARSTGYYQLHQLEKFLEAYVLAKKTDSSLRLAFANWKEYQGQVTLVTPLQFSYRKSAPSGMEYMYQLSLRGWKRTALVGSTLFDVAPPFGFNLATFNKLMNVLSAVSILVTDIQQFPKVMQAGEKNFENLTEPLRKARVYSKTQLGQSLSLADLPQYLRDQALSNYQNTSSDQKVGYPGQVFPLNQTITNLKLQTVSGLQNTRPNTSQTATDRTLRGVLNQTVTDAKLRAISFAQLDAVSVNLLSPNQATMAAIFADKNSIAHYSRFDWQKQQQTFVQAANQIAFALNAGSVTVADTYNITTNSNPPKSQPSDSDWEILWALDDALQAFDTLVANSRNASTDSPAIDSMVQLTRRLGIAFNKPVSKFAVPMPYKMSLEQLATKYLGSPDRAIEIATLNGLKSPYIDEEGFQLPLLVNGSGQTVTINSDPRLYVNQPVWLGSNSSTITRHHITNIRKVSDTLMVTLDGDPVDLYKTRDQAYLQAFTPDTINSQSLVYIPSNQEPISGDVITASVPGIDQFDPLVAVGGIDLQLDSNNDLIIGADGDGRYCWGLTNIIQWTRVVLGVPLGQLQLHQDFGIAAKIGESTADVQASVLADSVRNSLVKHGLFSSIDKVKVSKKGPTASIDVVASVYGYSQPIPVSYQIGR